MVAVQGEVFAFAPVEIAEDGGLRLQLGERARGLLGPGAEEAEGAGGFVAQDDLVALDAEGAVEDFVEVGEQQVEVGIPRHVLDEAAHFVLVLEAVAEQLALKGLGAAGPEKARKKEAGEDGAHAQHAERAEQVEVVKFPPRQRRDDEELAQPDEQDEADADEVRDHAAERDVDIEQGVLEHAVGDDGHVDARGHAAERVEGQAGERIERIVVVRLEDGKEVIGAGDGDDDDGRQHGTDTGALERSGDALGAVEDDDRAADQRGVGGGVGPEKRPRF